MNKILLTAVFLGASFVSASAQHVMFRGENHCGRYHEAWAGGKARGALICADGMFYMFDERRGMVGLARINPDKLDVVSEFRFTDGSGACFSHPTIFDGVMYIRRGPALVAYKVKG